MSLLKVVLVVLNVSVIHGFLSAPTVVSPLRVSFLGLAAGPQQQEEPNNAFDLIDDELRVTLSEELGIVQPNEIQNSSLPCAIRGDDTFVIAQTGSGKTMSFMLPILHRLRRSSSSPQRRRSVALVIVPTEELLAQHSTIASTLMPSVSERILFKTPEQIIFDSASTADDEDFAANVDIVAIDEVDAVLCGSEFNDTIPEKSIELLGRLPDQAQYILTTAHLTRAHTKIINRLFPDINTIRQSSSSRRVLVPTLRQVFHYFSGDMSAKLDKLRRILEDSEKDPTIIFCKDENEVETVHRFIENCNALKDVFSPEKLHVGLPSEDRSNALSRFRSSSTTTNDDDCCSSSRMLVTHEIAARGLDCPSVRHVILFDTPTDVTAFVHRAGRTARAGEEGLVTCMVQAGGGIGSSFGVASGGGSFGKHKNLHELLDAPKLNFAKATTSDNSIE